MCSLLSHRSLLAAQAAVPRQDMAVVTGTRNFVRLFGSTISLAIGAALVNNSLRTTLFRLALSPELASTILNDPTAINDGAVRAQLAPGQRDAIINGYLSGFRNVFYMTIACQLVAFLSAVLLIEEHGLDRDDDRAQKDRSKAMLLAKKAKRRARKETGDADLEAAEGEKEKDGAEEDEKDGKGDENRQ